VRDLPLDFKGFEVVALNVTKLRSDNFDPREYLSRLEVWRARSRRAAATGASSTTSTDWTGCSRTTLAQLTAAADSPGIGERRWALRVWTRGCCLTW